ncbi:LOW QUALITY PROTEIN: kinesin-like protein KIF20A [Boleophthalmus pectinirostris]|uniref:LOW QUALITY PROTEIN: kinesin-like protein KIF20A n=1 Tax=Boleophthalmus pectinirostris TaxID=150288 RepID=UPI00242E8190|nr:LOW QUALITY PROTEIN: kinesin-like protein KIF20A [Boleophthalmus pectinirostris]
MSSTNDFINDESVNHQPMDMDVTLAQTTTEKVQESSDSEPQTMSVYLRVRPFSKEELNSGEDQECVVIENDQTVTLNAPKGSANMKSSEKGIGMSIHKFSFTQIFGPDITQAKLFEETVQCQMSDFLNGSNALIFSYGVTNAGKTYTIQGSPKDPGILPRVLDATFQHIRGHQYEAMDVKPYLRNDAQFLTPDQVKQEKSIKAAIFTSCKEESDTLRGSCGNDALSMTLRSRSPSCSSFNETVVADSTMTADGGHFALWVAFFEIYNECVYDLLQPALCCKSKKRAVLRVCDDGAGNAYVKDLRWINIMNLSEANKILQYGNKNRSAAATKMNQCSSRSHSIFTMKLLKIDNDAVKAISEFSLCDLAGSERCNKTKTFGERLKEAANINNSLLILGKCIMALRNNQGDRSKSCIPFRESKLTKLFQSFFCGKGKASMIVNINQCASTYDETLHVMKFSAVARQVVQVIPDKSVHMSQCLFGRDGKPLVRPGTDSPSVEGYLSEEELLDEEDEADMSLMPQNELLNIIENLKSKLLAERRKNLVQEMEIRKEMGDAMMQQIMESEELRSREIEELKESYQEKLENTFEMYKEAIKEHAYQNAMRNLEDDYVPLDEFTAEQEKVEELKRQLETAQGRGGSVETTDRSTQTETPRETETAELRCKRLYQEKSALETICESKQQLIVSLEKSLKDLNEGHKWLTSCLSEKSLEAETLERKAQDLCKSLEDVLLQNIEKDREIETLKQQLENKSLKTSPLPPKPKRGLLANIKDAVTSPRNSGSARTLRKTVRAVKR